MIANQIICYLLTYPELYFNYDKKLLRSAEILGDKYLSSINEYFSNDGTPDKFNLQLWLIKNSEFDTEKINEFISNSIDIENKFGVFSNSEHDFSLLVADLEEQAKKKLLKSKLVTQLKNVDKVNSSTTIEQLYEIVDDYENTDKPIKRYSQNAPEIIERLKEQKDIIKFKKYGSINCMTEGIALGDYVIVIGYAKSGKTTICYNLLLDYVLQNIPVCSCQLELTEDSAYSNILAITNKMKYSHFRSGQFNPETLKILDVPLYMQNERNIDLMLANFKELKNKHNVKTFFIDQLSHIESGRQFDSPTPQYMYISKRLEKFAKKENVRIFLAVQDGRGGKGNMKSDAVGWTDSVIKDGDFVLKINKYDNLDEKIIKEELPLFTPPLYKDYLSVVALTESRHTAFRGIGTIVETFADKSIQEIYSPLGAYVNGTFIDKPKQQGE